MHRCDSYRARAGDRAAGARRRICRLRRGITPSAPYLFSLLLDTSSSAAGSGAVCSPRLPARSAAAGVQIADLSAVALLMGVSGGFHWPLFGLYLFLPTAAAYRWGLVAALATTAAVLCFLGTTCAGQRRLMVAERVFYLGVSGVLVGYIAGREKRSRDESAAIAEICCGMKGERGMMGSLKSLFPKLREITGARAILLVAREPRYGRLFLWRLCDAPDTGLRSAELVPSEHDVYLFPMASEAWFTRQSSADEGAARAAGLRGSPSLRVIVRHLSQLRSRLGGSRVRARSNSRREAASVSCTAASPGRPGTPYHLSSGAHALAHR